MSFTNFPNGITSFGVPVFGGGPGHVASGAPGVSLGVTSIIGNTWFVDTVFGADGNSGLSPQEPFSTMERAFQTLKSGDVINFRGRVGEQLVAPTQVFDVWINGLGNSPRHADATPLGGQYAAAQWGAPTSGAVVGQATLRVLQQGWKFTNFLFTAGDATAACLEIVRNAGAGNAERDASHALVQGVRFSGAGIGVRGGVAGEFTEIPFNVKLLGCQFDNMTTAIGSAIEVNAWEIAFSRFFANTNNIVLVSRQADIHDNLVGDSGTPANIILTGATAGNRITKNTLGGTYSIAGGYSSAGTDEWWGNFANVAGGVTQNAPA